MTRRTVARGSLTMRQDIGQRDMTLDFSKATVGATPDMTGREYFTLPYERDWASELEYALKDDRICFGASGVVSPEILSLNLCGDLTPVHQWGPVVDVSILVYLDNIRFELVISNNIGTLRAMAYTYTASTSRKIVAYSLSGNPFGTDTTTAMKDIHGWVWMRLHSDVAERTLSVKAWNEADDEPLAWDAQVVDPARLYGHIFPAGTPMFIGPELRGLSAVPGEFWINKVQWRHS